MGVIARRLQDQGEDWRHVYKSLLLLEYMSKHGPQKVSSTEKPANHSMSPPSTLISMLPLCSIKHLSHCAALPDSFKASLTLYLPHRLLRRLCPMWGSSRS